jgi:hypothetical protein
MGDTCPLNGQQVDGLAGNAGQMMQRKSPFRQDLSLIDSAMLMWPMTPGCPCFSLACVPAAAKGQLDCIRRIICCCVASAGRHKHGGVHQEHIHTGMSATSRP